MLLRVDPLKRCQQNYFYKIGHARYTAGGRERDEQTKRRWTQLCKPCRSHQGERKSTIPASPESLDETPKGCWKYTVHRDERVMEGPCVRPAMSNSTPDKLSRGMLVMFSGSAPGIPRTDKIKGSVRLLGAACGSHCCCTLTAALSRFGRTPRSPIPAAHNLTTLRSSRFPYIDFSVHRDQQQHRAPRDETTHRFGGQLVIGKVQQ